MEHNEIRKAVRKNYGKVAESDKAGCGCAPSTCCQSGNTINAEDVSVALGYSNTDISSVPDGANMGLGCGNPQAIAAQLSDYPSLALNHGYSAAASY